MRGPVGPVELDILVSLGLGAAALAPSFSALLRDAVMADWVQLQWWDGGLRRWRYACLGAEATRRGQLLAALDQAAYVGLGPHVHTLAHDATPTGARADSHVVSAVSPCERLRVQCVGAWPERAQLGRTVAATAAAASALSRCPPQASTSEPPTLELHEGLLLVGADGAPQGWTQSAGTMLALVRDSLPADPGGGEDGEQLLRWRLRALIERSPRAMRSARDTPPPSERFETPFGGIQLQAMPLHGPVTAGTRLLRCLRETPLPVALVEGVARLPLSMRQKQVAVHAANGMSYPAISERLGLSRATVIDYMQSVYDKLAVGSHEHLAVHLASHARA
jgi:DNA-binding CsgD family transcriptional regulator